MRNLANTAAQQRAGELPFSCQLGQVEVYSLVVQDRLVKRFLLVSVVNSSLCYYCFQQCWDWKKQSTEQDVILTRSVAFLLEKDGFSHCTNNTLGFVK